MNGKKETQDVTPSENTHNETILVLEGRHQEGSEDDDDDDKDDLDMGDILNLEFTKILVVTMNGTLKASAPMKKKTMVTMKLEKVGLVAHQKFAQLTSVSVGFYLVMVAVSSGSRLTIMQDKSQK